MTAQLFTDPTLVLIRLRKPGDYTYNCVLNYRPNAIIARVRYEAIINTESNCVISSARNACFRNGLIRRVESRVLQ